MTAMPCDRSAHTCACTRVLHTALSSCASPGERGLMAARPLLQQRQFRLRKRGDRQSTTHSSQPASTRCRLGCPLRLSRCSAPHSAVVTPALSSIRPVIPLLDFACMLRRWFSTTGRRSRCDCARWRTAGSCTCPGTHLRHACTSAVRLHGARHQRHTASVHVPPPQMTKILPG